MEMTESRSQKAYCRIRMDDLNVILSYLLRAGFLRDKLLLTPNDRIFVEAKRTQEPLRVGGRFGVQSPVPRTGCFGFSVLLLGCRSLCSPGGESAAFGVPVAGGAVGCELGCFCALAPRGALAIACPITTPQTIAPTACPTPGPCASISACVEKIRIPLEAAWL